MSSKLHGCGIGLRREFIKDLNPLNFKPDWFEVTPENWIHMPYEYRELFEEVASSNTLAAHGLSLSIGSPEPLDKSYLKDLKTFLDRFNIEHYSEHLSFSTFEGGQTYELLPLPMTQKMVSHVSDRVKEVQDYLGRALILENASYYHVPYTEMPEVEFVNSVMSKSGAKMLLDVNNVYVNSQNHKFDAKSYMKELDTSKVAYMHIAGHLFYPEDNMIIDTHGEDVRDEVWDLLDYTLNYVNAPVMLERDNNIPDLKVLQQEYAQMCKIASKHQHA